MTVMCTLSQTLGYLVTDCNPGLPANSLRDVAAYLCEVLAERLSDSSLPLDRASSHLIYSPLRLLQAIIPQARFGANSSGILSGFRSLLHDKVDF